MNDSKESVWKNYDKNEITHSVAHYLFSIDEIHKDQGYVRAVDISKQLDITPGSCSVALKSLLKKGLIIEDDNKIIGLSLSGKKEVKRISATRDVFYRFFSKTLGLNENLSLVNACKIEHLIDEEVTKKMKEYIA